MRFAQLLACSVGLAVALPAVAGATIVYKQQSAEVYNGVTDTGSFNSVIGSNPPFGTTEIDTTDANGSLTLDILTNFTGSVLTTGDCFGNVCAHAADIAVSIDGGRTYAYGIALGYDKNGLTAGLYQVSSWATSQDVWGPAGNGFDYGGAWQSCDATAQGGSTVCGDANAQVADTVIDVGTLLAAATVTQTADGLVVNVADGMIGHAVSDIFWGTADCSNDPTAGNIPEPASIAVFGLALVTLGLVRRRSISHA